nr:hypothetical protein [uncultured Anaerobutyricum sp.]
MFAATFLQILEHLYMLRRFLKVMLLDCQTALIQDVILKVIKAQQLVMEFILSTQTLEKSQCVLKIQKNLGNGVILVSLQNSKAKVTAITITGNKEYTMALEDDSIYILTYSENISDNVKAETINYAIIISRQKSGKTGGVYINNSSVEEKITLDDNILKFAASGWWARAYIKKL